MDTKPVLDSLTIRALLGVVIGFLITKFGLPFDAAVLSDGIVEAIGAVTEAVSVVVAAYGRIRASQPLG